MGKIVYSFILSCVFLFFIFSQEAFSAQGSLVAKRVSLSGEWEFTLVDLPKKDIQECNIDPDTYIDKLSLLLPDTKVGWYKVYIPCQAQTSAMAYWYRRDFVIPEDMQLHGRIRIRFERVCRYCVIFINGHEAGRHYYHYTPFEFDITDFVYKDGRTNSIYVGVVSTIGHDAGHWGNILNGIWGDVAIVNTPAIVVENTWIRTSYREGKIDIEITIRNNSDKIFKGSLLNSVLADGRQVRSFGRKEISIDCGQNKKFVLSQTWKNPRYWSPEDPYLYHLRTTIESDSKEIDIYDTRFGFRELWVEKDKFYFNGVKFFFHGSSSGPMDYHAFKLSEETKENALNFYKTMRSYNVNYVRFHLVPPREMWVDAADETGMLIQSEFDVLPYNNPTSSYGSNESISEKRWQRARGDYKEAIELLRNHPSIIIWSAENEYFMHHGPESWKTGDKQHILDRLMEIKNYIKHLDPTRPITFEGDGDLNGDLLDPGFGHTEMTCWHYDRMYYMGFVTYPNDCYWLEKKDAWPSWNRSKPLWLGEGISVTGIINSIDAGSIFRGDWVYEDAVTRWHPDMNDDSSRWHLTHIPLSDCAREVIKGYRFLGVNGFAPFSYFQRPPFAIRTGKYMAPVACFIHEATHNFFANEEVTRTILVYNHIFEKSHFVLDWRLKLDSGEVVKSGKIPVSVEAGESVQIFLRFTAPDCNARTNGRFMVRLLRPQDSNIPIGSAEPHQPQPPDDCIFVEEKNISIFPNLKPLKLKSKIGIWDPQNQLSPVGNLYKLDFRRLQDLSNLDRNMCDILIIAPFQIPCVDMVPGEKRDSKYKEVLGGLEAIRKFVEAGGRLLVLEQEEFPSQIFGNKIRLQSLVITMAFLRASNHPVLTDMGSDDFKWWREDNIVCYKPFIKPYGINCLPIIDAGSQQGPVISPLLELKYGKGTTLLCQLDIIRKIYKEPVTQQLFANMLRYLSDYSPYRLYEMKVFADLDSPMSRYLKEMFNINVANTSMTDDVFKEHVLLVDARDAPNIKSLQEAQDQVKNFVYNGGTLILHNPDESVVPFVKDISNVTLNTKPMNPEQRNNIWKKGTPALLDGISNYDLYWVKHSIGQVVSQRQIVRYLWTTDSPQAQILTEPGGIILVPFGKGKIIIDPLLWDIDAPGQFPTDKKAKYVTYLLTNLGVYVDKGTEPEQAQESGKTFFLDLHNVVNMSFTDDEAGDGKGGWSDQGPQNDMSSFPTGRQIFRDVPFDIIDPDQNNNRSCLVPEFLSEEQKGKIVIPVGRKVKKLFFLHAAAWSAPEYGEIASILVNYADGTSEKIPVRTNYELLDWWWGTDDLSNAKIAWQGRNESHDICVYMLGWKSPHPLKEIKNLTLDDEPNKPYYMLIAVTGFAPVDIASVDTKQIPLVTDGPLQAMYQVETGRSQITVRRITNDPVQGEPAFFLRPAQDVIRTEVFELLSFSAQMTGEAGLSIGFEEENGRRVIAPRLINLTEDRADYLINLSEIQWEDALRKDKSYTWNKPTRQFIRIWFEVHIDTSQVVEFSDIHLR